MRWNDVVGKKKKNYMTRRGSCGEVVTSGDKGTIYIKRNLFVSYDSKISYVFSPEVAYGFSFLEAQKNVPLFGAVYIIRYGGAGRIK